jgi:hypothetical protein
MSFTAHSFAGSPIWFCPGWKAIYVFHCMAIPPFMKFSHPIVLSLGPVGLVARPLLASFFCSDCQFKMYTLLRGRPKFRCEFPYVKRFLNMFPRVCPVEIHVE